MFQQQDLKRLLLLLLHVLCDHQYGDQKSPCHHGSVFYPEKGDEIKHQKGDHRPV